jgi:hypothetical protein
MLESLRGNLRNAFGWSTEKKIVVFEVDDYGSIRMPSLPAYTALLKAGLKVDQSRFTRYDTLEDSDDLSNLFEILMSVKDAFGRPAVFTPLCLVANPDFERIKRDGFESYYYELLPQTLSRLSGKKTWELWTEGVQNKIFCPQFHGREHLYVQLWMEALKANHKATLLAFSHGTFGLRYETFGDSPNGYMAAFDCRNLDELQQMRVILEDGLEKFEELFGYTALCFTPPNAILSSRLEESLALKGVTAITVAKLRKDPLGRGRYRRRFRFIGQRNRYKQTYVTRNCLFEPGLNGSVESVARCIHDIQHAFNWGKPAIISSHRVNFVGGLNVDNRDKGLRELDNLLRQIIVKWPDVRFLSSADLVKLMDEDFNESSRMYEL